MWLKGRRAAQPGCGREETARGPSSGHGFHRCEKEEFLRLLEQVGDVLTPEAEAVLDLFLQTEGHLSADFVRKGLEGRGKRVEVATVQAALEQFCRYGIAQETRLNGGAPCYEHLHLDAHHDHLLCTHCGRVEEFLEPQLETWQDEVARRHAFQPLRHRLVIYGLCAQCREHREPALPLSVASCGERVKIIRFAEGCGIEGRLNAMGLMPGDIVEVLNNAGPFIVSAKGGRLALGRGLAEKVLVSLVSEARFSTAT